MCQKKDSENSYNFSQEECEDVIIKKFHPNIQNSVHVAAMMYASRFIKNVSEIADVRSVAIVRMLNLECLVDSILSFWIVGYVSELKGRTRSFDYKISLLKSLRLIPNKILVAIKYFNLMGVTNYLYHIKILADAVRHNNLLEQIQYAIKLPEMKVGEKNKDGSIPLMLFDPIKENK